MAIRILNILRSEKIKKTIHDLVLERPQSPQLSGGFKCSDAARAQALDPYRERLVLLGVLLFQVACNTTIT